MTRADERPVRRFRLAVADASTNHAIDEALLESVAGGAAAVLRFYTWSEPAISLGASQVSGDLDIERCSREGIGIVRRASGGSAVLHENHLGFSLILPSNHHLVGGDIVHSYQRLGTALRTALGMLGASVELISPHEARAFRPEGLAARACLAGYGPWEPRLAGRKLIGHAQVRRRRVVLYHALLPMSGDPGAIARFLSGGDEERAAAAEVLSARVGTLEIALGRSARVSEVVTAVKSAVTGLDITLESGELSDKEAERAQALREEKYRQPDWTFRR